MDQDTTGQVRSVDVATLLTSIANQLSQNRSQLDQVDRKGTHGERIAQAFTAAAQAAENTGGDAGTQLQAAAEAMKAQGSGKAAQFYADGLLSAADQFAGQSGISADNLGSFLKSFVGGVGQNNPAKPGQGTMLDALNPALSALTSARGQGQDTIGAMSSALGAAITGTQRTAGTAGRVDPGAASATNVLGGIFAALAPTLLNTILNRVTGGQSSAGGAGGLGGLLGGLFGGATGGSGSMQSQGNTGNPLGGLLGGSGGSSSTTGQSGAGTDWVGGLLGGLMGGGQGTSAGGSGLSGDALGGLLSSFTGSGADTSGDNTTLEQSNHAQSSDDSGLGGLLGGMFGGNKGN